MRLAATLLCMAGLLASCQTAAPTETTPAAVAPQQAPAPPVPAPPVYVTAICGDCHAVVADRVSPNPQAPGFADIANSPGLTRETLVTFLSDAHNYPLQMDVDLDAKDIETIANYIVTLKSEDYHRTPS